MFVYLNCLGILLCRTFMRNDWGSYLALLFMAILNFLGWLHHRFKIKNGYLTLALLGHRDSLAHKRCLERRGSSQLPSIGIIEIVISHFLLFNSPPTARNLAPRVIIVNLCLRTCRFSKFGCKWGCVLLSPVVVWSWAIPDHWLPRGHWEIRAAALTGRTTAESFHQLLICY